MATAKPPRKRPSKKTPPAKPVAYPPPDVAPQAPPVRPLLGVGGPPPPLPDDLPGSMGAEDGADGTAPAPLLVPGPGFPFPSPGPSFPVPSLSPFRSLRHGCYLIRYTPRSTSQVPSLTHYDGTMRVERQVSNTVASGDLYRHTTSFVLANPFPQPGPGGVLLPPTPNPEVDPAKGIPTFPRSRYSYYLRVTKILEGLTSGTSFELGFELHSFNSTTNAFTNAGNFTAQMTWTTAPSGFPSPADYLRGSVKNASGAVVGTLTMGWVSPFLRRATLEIDRVSVSESPLSNGAGVSWKTVFDQVGWDLQVVESNADIAEPSGELWSDAEMHATMLARRDASNLDTEWRFYVLCVRRLDSTERGIMFDNGATDSNKVPREGAGIASHWVVPNSDPWGLIKGKRFGTATGAYFRTALHEIGHAMGLFHNTIDLGIMNTTDVIAAAGTPANPFPNNIKWSLAANDQKRLRHLPDPWVRPGGIPFGASSLSSVPLSPDDARMDAEDLELRIEPLLELVPLGAPVRINLTLRNASAVPRPAPASLSLRDGFVRGKVIDPSGTVRSFVPLIHCADEHPLRLLAPGESLEGSATLLRGPEGALFPSAGAHRVVVDAEWDWGGVTLTASGETHVMVTPIENTSHAAAAFKVLTTPDVLLTLVLGGDHLGDGIAAVQAALGDSVLRPHYAMAEAKRISHRFFSRRADLNKAVALLDEKTVLSQSEIGRVATMVAEAPKQKQEGARRQKLVRLLQRKVKEVKACDSVSRQVDALE